MLSIFYRDLQRLLYGTNMLILTHTMDLHGGIVPKTKLTNRKAQAQKTKKKIHKVAMQLMNKKGFNNTTIAEISQKAKVSVGTFYLYFQSKEDIFLDIYDKADVFFRDEVSGQLEGLSTPDQIVYFFKCYGRYTYEQGLDAISQLWNTKNKLFISSKRHMRLLLEQILKEGQDKNELTTEMTPKQMADYLFIVARGTVYDWCLHDGNYDLEQILADYVQRLIPIFIIM